MFHQLIHINYATILIILSMITFLVSNTVFTKQVARMFMNSIICVLLLVIVDSVETWTESLETVTTLRIFMSAMGYTLRPIGILNILLIVSRSININHKILLVPAIVNGLVSFSALFSDIAFSYSENNEFIRGPLGFFAYAVCAIYLFTLLVITAVYLKERHRSESIIIFSMLFFAVLSLYLEVVYKFDGFINATFAISITFYYLFFYAQTTKRDVLTLAFNRGCFYDDAVRNYSRLKGVISIDLNDLKKLNDNNGHACGDTALCTVVSTIKKVLPYGCNLYRTGGDEFMILCFRHEQDDLEKLVATIRNEIKQTPYTCSFGLAMLEENEDLDQVCARADTLMYEDKIRIKGSAR